MGRGHEIVTDAKVRRARKHSQALQSYNFTGVGEASGAFLLAKALSPRKRDLLLTRSNLLSWLEIVIEPDGIRNLKPQKGEPEFLMDQFQAGKQNDGETHALISRMPGPSGVGEFLVIAGNASPRAE